ncbi:DNA polymerase subunit beta [Thiohalocapsa halophila]|uniref:DNA polymerase subunit beta n=1 Tax=Thiohalocapsa halophila TaxID=69359 RepID=A0ABS1CDY1_9GAMM|nr:nucleotidyltransferase domain-containing protein [Thiohalocapsa halophila]MBK1630111.1 DNA polymerase subunit beta [Thiohalocapsa halophila]
MPFVEKLTDALRGEDGDLLCAYLFGSVARGEDRPDSDVDLAVLFRDDPPRTLAGLHLDLADRLTGALGGRRVDLVVLNRAPVDLVHRVLRDGVLLLERDRSARIRFEVRARNEYFDLLPHLERYRRGRDEAGR